ncbi:von Willebrand factor type C domain family protein [Brugia pahangi]
MWPENCLKAKCDMVYLHKCPEDSRLVIPPPPPGECCAPPGECHCDIQKCYPLVPVCESGLERVLVKKGINEPGHCCDIFECKQPELQCENVHCDRHFLDYNEEECPNDSIRTASYVPAGTCCPINPECRCRASICMPASCPEGQKVKILQKGDGTPGRCCDQFTCENGDDMISINGKRCPYNGEIYDDGERWHTGSCEQCKCKSGIALCSKMTCASPPSHCTWVAIPENECCPVCLGCQTDGKKHKRNETWQKDDCTTCSCGPDGVHYCQKHMCQVECDNPRKIPGQCCPICDEPTIIVNPAICPSLEHCPLRCENGLLRDSNGCFQCKCAPVQNVISGNCRELSDVTCDKICAHGYLRDIKSCPVCKCAKCPPLHQCYKHCLYGFESNNNGCPVCKCRAMSRIDAKLLSLQKEPDGWDKCYSFSTQTGKLYERDSGEWWNDGCRHCFCEQKHEFCSLISCPQRNESCPIEHWKKREDACCASCDLKPLLELSKHEHTVCQSAGRLFVDGETWQLAPCTSCTCRVGNVLCRVVECPPIACPIPIFDERNQCCPKCPEETKSSVSIPEVTLSNIVNVVCTDNNYVVHVAGSSWRTDECTSCKCVAIDGDAKIECFEEKCRQLTDCRGIPLTIKGRCCPVCSDVLSSGAVCSYGDNVYSVNEEWRDGPCRNCTCQPGGGTICKEQQCAKCNDSIQIPGYCCPICKDVEWRSFGEGQFQSVLSDGNDSSSSLSSTTSQMNTMLYGVCLTGFILIGVIVFILIYKLIKQNKNNDEKKSPIHYNSSTVLLSATKAIGSTPQLYEDMPTRRDSCDDGQSELLISSNSETSSASSSNGSSGYGPHYDTLPLNPVKKSVSRTKSMDYGIRRGFGSFKNNAFGKLDNKHGSCNV